MITQEELKEFLHYEPTTGIFTWKKNRGVKKLIGIIAGCKDKQGYIVIRIKRKSYKSHRLAFLYMVGSIPDCIDHIDRDKCNNKWNNLREATRSQNQGNLDLRSDNTSGFRGVVYRGTGKRKKRWVAQLGIKNGKTRKNIIIGSFTSPEEAARAYDEKCIEIFGEFAKLNFSVK